MKIGNFGKIVLSGFFGVIATANVLEARQSSPDEACGTACGSIIMIIIAIVALNIALLVWVTRDAKNRGMGEPILWMLLVLFTGPIGLIIYLLSRVSGELVYCEFCKHKRLKAATACPHCGNTSKSIATKPVGTSRLEYCSNCGHKMPPEAIFCEECGKKIEK